MPHFSTWWWWQSALTLYLQIFSNILTTVKRFSSFKGLYLTTQRHLVAEGGRMCPEGAGLLLEHNRAHGCNAFLLHLFHAPPLFLARSLPLSLYPHVLSPAPLVFSWPLLRSCCLVTAGKMTRSVGCVRGASRAMCLHIRHRRCHRARTATFYIRSRVRCNVVKIIALFWRNEREIILSYQATADFRAEVAHGETISLIDWVILKHSTLSTWHDQLTSENGNVS